MGKLAILERARLMGKLEHNTKHPGLGCFLSYFSQFALTQLRLHTGLVLLVGPRSMMQSCKHLRSSLVQFFCGIVCGTKLRQIVFFLISLSRSEPNRKQEKRWPKCRHKEKIFQYVLSSSHKTITDKVAVFHPLAHKFPLNFGSRSPFCPVDQLFPSSVTRRPMIHEAGPRPVSIRNSV